LALKRPQTILLDGEGSVNECIPHLRFAVSEGIIAAEHYPRLKRDLDVVGKMITALIAYNPRRD